MKKYLFTLFVCILPFNSTAHTREMPGIAIMQQLSNQFRIGLVLLLSIFCVHDTSAQSLMTGNVTDSQSNPIIGATCVLCSLPDSMVVATTVTDSVGQFRLSIGLSSSDMRKRKYILRFTSLGFEKVERPYIGNSPIAVVMKEDTHLLKEVVVSSQTLKSFGNKEYILLNESQKKIGSNALDAIESLPQFKRQSDGGDLITIENKTVLVLIDGVHRTSRDLMLLKADDIKSITYYSNPPAHYAYKQIGAVIDVTTKRKRERLYSLYLNTKNSVTTGYGTNLLSMAYSDSLNMVSAAYFIDYRNLNKNTMDNIYSYPKKVNGYRGVGGHYSGRYHIGQMTYQRYQGKNLFNAKVEYDKSPGKQWYEQRLVTNGRADESNSRQLKSKASALSVDLYLMHTFKNQSNLSLNMVNTYQTSYSHNKLTRNDAGYSFENNLDNKSFSFISEILYTGKLWRGDFNIGTYYEYKNLHQRYNEEGVSKVRTQKEYVYADFNKGIGKLSYNVGIGLENNHYHTITGEVFDYLVFRPMLTLNLKTSECASFRLASSINSSIPSVGSLTNSVVTVDEHFYTQGNPGLKPCYYSRTTLDALYSSKNGKVQLSSSIIYSYYPKRNVPVIVIAGNGDFIQRLTRIDNAHELGTSFSLSYRPIRWLAIQPYYNYLLSCYDTPNLTVNHNQHNAGVSFLLTPKRWQLVWNVNLPVTTVEGDIYEKNGLDMSASMLYKYKTVSVGIHYIYHPNPSKIHAAANAFSYSEETKWGNFKNLIALSFTYYFSKGKSRSHAGKQFSNADKDSGLTKYNTAK